MNQTLYLFCEGERGSIDVKILTKVIAGLSGVEIMPLGGKFASGAYLKGFLDAQSGGFGGKAPNNGQSPEPLHLTFRDRDFDAPIPNEIELTSRDPQKRVWFSHRVTIENYLLLPKNVFNFCQSSKEKSTANFTTVQNVQDIFKKAAQDIKYYQAARWALGVMRYKAELRTTWTERSGRLPKDLDKISCCANAHKEIEKVQGEFSTYTATTFDEHFQKYIDIFNDAFFENEDYLVWFQAKDLQKQLVQYLPNFNYKSFYNKALDSFVYQDFPDLVQLRNEIISKLNPHQ
jgi:hypothetical protein